MNASDSNTQDVYKVNSLTLSTHSNALDGHVRWDPCRSLWNGGMLLGALVLGPMTFTWGALAVFVVVLAIIMCAGHSVGFHRLLIHRTFECPMWLERTLVWVGVLFGMQGPYWMIRTHDFRDWAQRQPNCHAYLRHGHGLLRDGWWNLHCRLVLADPPGFDPGESIATTGSTGSYNEPGWRSRFRWLSSCFSLAVCRGWCGASSSELRWAFTRTGMSATCATRAGPRTGWWTTALSKPTT